MSGKTLTSSYYQDMRVLAADRLPRSFSPLTTPRPALSKRIRDAGPIAGIASLVGFGWLATILYIDAFISPGGTASSKIIEADTAGGAIIG